MNQLIFAAFLTVNVDNSIFRKNPGTGDIHLRDKPNSFHMQRLKNNIKKTQWNKNQIKNKINMTSSGDVMVKFIRLSN